MEGGGRGGAAERVTIYVLSICIYSYYIISVIKILVRKMYVCGML